MKRIFFALCAGTIGCALFLQLPTVASGRSKETVVHTFAGAPDGASPYAGLIDVNGTLYGTTSSGGAHCQKSGGCGTVFSINPTTGAETVLYSFCGAKKCADGENPSAALVAVNGILYGTTQFGGTNGRSCGGPSCGTVFSLDPNSGVETVLHTFGKGADGAWPSAGLIDVSGILYGTTDGGGWNCQSTGGCGTVYAIDPTSGAETVLYSFCGQQKCRDGSQPNAGLIAVKGALYGTTSGGGAHCETHGGCGTVFVIDAKTGAEGVLYSFCALKKCEDGSLPTAGLIAMNGALYGTTSQGGANATGTLFSLDPGIGVETVRYAFCSQANCADGASPNAGLIAVKGKLYGTTPWGGASCQEGGTCGTVFAFDPHTGAETVLHAFGSGLDGAVPFAGLIHANGRFYGTTNGGGADGKGTAFALTP